MGTPREDLAKKLREARIAAGYETQSALAKRLNLSRPVISKAENAAQAIPNQALLTAWAGITGAPLDELLELANRARSGIPEWFMPYEVAEARADTLRCWTPLQVPGLLQTEAYMRVLFAAEEQPLDQVDALVAARMERKKVLGRARLTAIVDSTVLDREIGSAELMAEQCGYLAALSERPDVVIHVVPPRVNVGLWGALHMATRDGSTTVLLGALRDVTSTAADLVTMAVHSFERILGSALPRAESRNAILEAEQGWKARISAGVSPASPETAALTASK
jgi:transcriptional regulator with XRE-family HTH domain